tara:strand:+ start:181 stop:657 length:477 start_codon:yes stop_codon:yes gene_type:complete
LPEQGAVPDLEAKIIGIGGNGRFQKSETPLRRMLLHRDLDPGTHRTPMAGTPSEKLVDQRGAPIEEAGLAKRVRQLDHRLPIVGFDLQQGFKVRDALVDPPGRSEKGSAPDAERHVGRADFQHSVQVNERRIEIAFPLRSAAGVKGAMVCARGRRIGR